MRKTIRSAITPALVAIALIAGPALASNDTRFGEQYGLQKIGAEAAWASGGGTALGTTNQVPQSLNPGGL